MTSDDPLALNVKADALATLLYIIERYPTRLEQDGFVRLVDRVWLHRTIEPQHFGTSFHFALDPFEDEETGSKFLFLFSPDEADVATGLELLTTDREDLFWWAIWLADFRSSFTSKNNETGESQW